jgi:hypothetical protein
MICYSRTVQSVRWSTKPRNTSEHTHKVTVFACAMRLETSDLANSSWNWIENRDIVVIVVIVILVFTIIIQRRDLRAKERDLRAKERDLRAKDAKQYSQSIAKWFDEGLPEASLVYMGFTESFENRHHEPVHRIETDQFEIIDSIAKYSNCLKPHSLNSAVDSTGCLTFASKFCLRWNVSWVLQDLLVACDLNKEFLVVTDISVVGLQPDVWILERSGGAIGVPMCCGVVKRDEDLANEYHYGQLYNYMLQLRILRGRKHIFGILTNYNSWVICWLHDNSDAAAATSECIEDCSSQVKCDTPLQRQLCSTRTFSITDKMLPRVLVSVLRKLAHSSYIPVAPVGKRLYPKLTPLAFQWQVTDIPKLSLKALSAKNYYVLREYRRGGDGQVYLTCTASGALTVLKFLLQVDDSESNEERCLSEANHWKNIFPFVFVRVESVLGRSAVCMQYVFACENNGSMFSTILQGAEDAAYLGGNEMEVLARVRASDPREVARQAITTMANAGYYHEDLHWRHVGVAPTFSGRNISLRAVLIDLSRVSTVDSLGISVHAARSRMLATLMIHDS